MSGRFFLLLIAACAVTLTTLPGCVGEKQSDAVLTDADSAPSVEAETLEALPPLEIDMDEPLLLEDPGVADETPATEAESQNKTCLVCHANYEAEPLALWHAKADIACARCHGESIAHKNDENHATPPGHMYPLDKIDSFCSQCHESHDVAPARVIARWRNRTSADASAQMPVCTTCHGQHRLERRTMRWDKETGELLPNKQAE